MKDMKPVAWLVKSEYWIDRVFTDYELACGYQKKRSSGTITPLYAIPEGSLVFDEARIEKMRKELAKHLDGKCHTVSVFDAMLKAAQEEG